MIALAGMAAVIATASFLLGYRTARNEQIQLAQSSEESAALAMQAALEAQRAASNYVDPMAVEAAQRAAEAAAEAAESTRDPGVTH